MTGQQRPSSACTARSGVLMDMQASNGWSAPLIAVSGRAAVIVQAGAGTTQTSERTMTPAGALSADYSAADRDESPLKSQFLELCERAVRAQRLTDAHPRGSVALSLVAAVLKASERLALASIRLDQVQRLAEVPGLGADSAQQIIAEVGATAATFPSTQTPRVLDGRLPGNEETTGVNYSHRCPKATARCDGSSIRPPYSTAVASGPSSSF